MYEKKKGRSLKLGLICFLIGIGITGNLVGCGNQSNDGSTTSTVNSNTTEEVTTEAPTTEAVPEENVLSAGEMATLGDWEVTLDSFKVTDEIKNTYGSFTPSEGNKFVVATITVKNTGTTADTFINSYTFGNEDVVSKIFYQGTYEFSGTNLLGYSDDLHDQSLNPLSSLTGVVAYEVVDEAAGSDELELTLTLGEETVTYALK